MRAERRVEDERDEVRARKARNAQERRWHDRFTRAVRPEDERHERGQTDDEEREHLLEPALPHLDDARS